MATLHLSKKELLYMSALSGTDNIWGFDDPFKGESEVKVRAALLELQGVLLRKSCLEASIDGHFSIAQEYQKLLDTCMNSEHVYILSSSQIEEEQAQLRFFVNGNTIVRYQYNETATLAFTSRELMKAEIITFFGDAGSQEQPYSLVTSVARLRRMGSLSKQRFLQELRDSGCEEELALLIVDGLQGNSDFCSLLAYDRSGKQETLVGKLVALNFAGGSLMVTPGASRSDSVCFTRLNHEKLLSVLDEVLGEGEDVDIV